MMKISCCFVTMSIVKRTKVKNNWAKQEIVYILFFSLKCQFDVLNCKFRQNFPSFVIPASKQDGSPYKCPVQ